jgi:aminoglycoside phosphotransferase (APT) family kinase protein
MNRQTVEAYLRANMDAKISVNEVRVLSGGRSKQTILLSLTDGAGKPIERIIRRDMASSPTGATVPDEFALLTVLADHGYPVPRPFHCEPDATKLGGSPFIIVSKVVGALAGHIFDPPPSKAAVLDSARVLGQLHALPVADLRPTLRPQFQAAPDAAKLRALIRDLRKAWDEQSRAVSVTVDYAFQWLVENVDTLHPIIKVVHGDYSFHNILFDGEKVSAVLDWELVRTGHPAEDLAYIRPAALKRVNWDEFTAAYRAGGGPEIDVKDQLFYTLLEKLRLIVMLFKVRQFVEDGLSDDIEFIDAIIIAIPRLVQQMSAELRAYLGLRP